MGRNPRHLRSPKLLCGMCQCSFDACVPSSQHASAREPGEESKDFSFVPRNDKENCRLGAVVVERKTCVRWPFFPCAPLFFILFFVFFFFWFLAFPVAFFPFWGRLRHKLSQLSGPTCLCWQRVAADDAALPALSEGRRPRFGWSTKKRASRACRTVLSDRTLSCSATKERKCLPAFRQDPRLGRFAKKIAHPGMWVQGKGTITEMRATGFASRRALWLGLHPALGFAAGLVCSEASAVASSSTMHTRPKGDKTKAKETKKKTESDTQ